MIEVRDLHVRTGEGENVRGVSFALAPGEVHALLGGHGSGAVTLLETVAGLRRPAAGTVRVRGADPYERREAVRVATVWREGGLFPGLTVAEVVDTWRRWTEDPLTRVEALRLTGLADAAHTPFERLDAGRRRLLDLALALVGRSDVLLLDEPTSGLDTADAHRVWSVLHLLAAGGVTVLLTTRSATEAARADRAAILTGGHLSGGATARLRAA